MTYHPRLHPAALSMRRNFVRTHGWGVVAEKRIILLAEIPLDFNSHLN